MSSLCLFCSNKSLFNIHKYGKNNHIIRDDMIDFFGYQIECHLKDDYSLCDFCTIMLENLAKIKRFLLQSIYTGNGGTTKPSCFKKKWNSIASVRFEDVTDSPGNDSDSDNSNNNEICETNNLVTITKVVPCSSYSEQKLAEMAERENFRSISRGKSEDDEVARAFSKKKRHKKRRGWTPTPRPATFSLIDYLSTTAPALAAATVLSRPTSLASIPNTEVDENENNNKNNDGDNEEEEGKDKEDDDNDVNEGDEEDEEDSDDDNDGRNRVINNIVKKPISDEKSEIKLCCGKFQKRGLYFCDICHTKHPSREELNYHNKINNHKQREYCCSVCQRIYFSEFDFEIHWKQHVGKSLVCQKCKKRFLSKKALDTHESIMHHTVTRFDYGKKDRSCQRK